MNKTLDDAQLSSRVVIGLTIEIAIGVSWISVDFSVELLALSTGVNIQGSGVCHLLLSPL